MNSDTRSQVHALIDQLPPEQLVAMESLLRSLLDPLSRSLVNAQNDDEPFSEEDRRAVAEADAWNERNQPVPLEDVLGDLGLTLADWETMARTPLDQPLTLDNAPGQ